MQASLQKQRQKTKTKQHKSTAILKMAAVQPDDQIIVDNEETGEQESDGMSKQQSDGGPISPDGVDQLQPNSSTEDDDCESEEEESDEEEEEEDPQKEEEMNLDELDGAALLALTKSRLEKQPTPAAPQTAPENDADSDSENEDYEEDARDNDDTEHTTNAANAEGSSEEADAAKSPTPESPIEEKKSEAEHGAPDEPVKDQAYFLELAMKKHQEAETMAQNDNDSDLELAMRKSKEAELKAQRDTDPTYLLKLAEQKVAEANAKARADEESTPGEVIKPALEVKPTRSENSELWALLNYSKMRLETGSTPNVGGGKKSGSKQGSVRGDDNMSVSSKLSKASKRSLGSRRSIQSKSGAPISVLGGPGDLRNSQHGTSAEGGENKMDAPFPDVTNDGDDSVDGSVSLESNTKDREDDEDSEDEENSDDSDEEESSEEEEDLPDFLKDAEEAMDPEEARALYEAAKFKAASILSVSEEKLTDVQMLQAIAIAEEAARKGDDKFSTKRSLFKLNEASVEDLKAFLSFGIPKSSEEGTAAAGGEESVGIRQRWGSRWSNFKQRCNEIDDKKHIERAGQPSLKEMSSAAMLDLKAQIDELEQNIKKATS